ncbi:RidA family protein [Permianibacter sp. IMCC34836]|uniref:RidA family protein n=1 Tax=Permianibacter fluminis TaxID=2738515 RepID=UPI0015534289|nr:RidA family protein [Permianibacter fluminis]NQD38084.1 RidA family protein [Permianibacter fluminis]
MDITRTGTTARWSDTVSHNHTLYLVEVPTTLSADISGQAQEMLASLEQSLVSAGSSKARLLMATIYLSDISEIDAFNAIWDSWVPADTAPARACVQAKLAKPGYRVEIQVIAALA